MRWIVVTLALFVAPAPGQTPPAPQPDRPAPNDAGIRPGEAPVGIPPEALAPQADLTEDGAGRFNIHMRNVTIREALRLLSQRARRNITVTEAVNANVTIDMYQVSFEQALEALVMPYGYTWVSRGPFIIVCQPAERDAYRFADQPVQQRVYELHYITAEDVVPVVEKLLSAQGAITSTNAPKVAGVTMTGDGFDKAYADGLGGKSRAVGEFVIVRDYPDVLGEIDGVIARLDRRPKQVLIEAVILRARLADQNALGIDFNALAGVDFRSINTTSVGGTNLTPGDVPAQSFDNGVGAFQNSVSGLVNEGGLSIGVITNNVATFIRALEEMVDLTIVANPKVLCVNEQLGRVIVGRQDGYLNTIVTETAAVQTVEFIETGTQILFRPFIGDDGYIRLDIHPEDSSGGLTPDNLPFKDTTEVTSNVMVRDGRTLVIGGLFREVTSSRTRQFPWLGDIPGVGLLFSGKRDEVTREEVVVLITPHIIAGDELSESARVAADEIERKRVLAHRGLMPWGRERLAQAHFQWAIEHYRNGDRDKALWDLDLALMLNPLFSEADRFRAELIDTQTAEPDTSIIRHVLEREALKEGIPPAATPPAEPTAPPAEAPAAAMDVSSPAAESAELPPPAWMMTFPAAPARSPGAGQ